MTEKNHKIGVLLLSLGTPESLDFKGVRRFLSEFLSDKFVIDAPRVFWLPLLHGVILNIRPFRSLKAYAKIWDHERGCSPLRTIAREQSDLLSVEFEKDDVMVDWAFRYGNPSIQEKLIAMTEAGCTRIFTLALYPQYSQTTVGTAYNKVVDVLSTLVAPPELRTGESYYNNPQYISAIKESVEDRLATLTWQPDVILGSYHSIPKRYADHGDPYRDHCEETHALLKEAFGPLGDKLEMSYQSRVGRMEWLRPYSTDKVRELAARGVKNLVVVSPCFAQDCLETLEEINLELQKEFFKCGGEHFHYVRCLNTRRSHMALLGDIIRGNIKDWQDDPQITFG